MFVKQDNVNAFPDGRVTAKDAASYLGLSEKTLAMKRCDGKGPKYIKRGRIFYYLLDLDSWLKEGSALSTAQNRAK